MSIYVTCTAKEEGQNHIKIERSRNTYQQWVLRTGSLFEFKTFFELFVSPQNQGVLKISANFESKSGSS